MRNLVRGAEWKNGGAAIGQALLVSMKKKSRKSPTLAGKIRVCWMRGGQIRLAECNELGSYVRSCSKEEAPNIKINLGSLLWF